MYRLLMRIGESGSGATGTVVMIVRGLDLLWSGWKGGGVAAGGCA